MKQRLIYVFTVCLIMLLASPNQASAVANDTIPRIEYMGYRLYLTHFETVKTKKEQLYIKLSVINTGNKKMMLGKGASQIFPVVKFDPSIDQANLREYEAAIYFQLLEEKITIPIGAITTNIELRLPLNPSEAEAPLVHTPSPEPEPIIEPEPSTEVAISEAAPKVEVENQPIAEASPKVEPESELESVPETPVETESYCSDLILKNVKILKRSKSSITLEYELFNQGLGKAPVIMGRKKEQESLAIRANLSSSEKLTRGAIVLGGSFLKGEETMLASGESYIGTLKVDLHKLTKFTPILILELDAYEFVAECDETNNIQTIQLLEPLE